MKALVSIIIPIYNSEKYLSRCIDSVRNQIYKNLEIILINDGSTDDSYRICNELSRLDERIRVIHKCNEGVSKARNIGLEISNGEYIFFMDSDDYIDKTVISELIQHTNKYDMIKIGYKLITRYKAEKVISNNSVYSNKDYIKKILLSDIGGHSWGYLIRKDMIRNLYFDQNTSCMEDTIFIINCIMNISKIKCVDTSYYNYRINENGITCSSNRIFENINDYMYSIDEIEKIISDDKVNYDLHEDLLKKKIKLIESEIAKITEKDDLNILFEDRKINTELNNIKNNLDINIVYKIFIYSILNKKYLMTMFYIKTRRLIKRAIKGR